MKQIKLLRLIIFAITLLGGVSSAWADPFTLASWTANKKWSNTATDETNKTKTYTYDSSIADINEIKYKFSEYTPYFYPVESVTDLSSATLTLGCSDTDKEWYITPGYNNGAFRFYTSTPTVITNYLDAAQHYNYAEVSFPATGYKNLQLIVEVSGNNSKTLPEMIVVSTDGGTTWMDGGEYTTGSSWSNFSAVTVNLAVTNQTNVRVRILMGYHSEATSDMYIRKVEIKGETYNNETLFTLSTSGTNGWAMTSPSGNTFISDTEVTMTAKNLSGYRFVEWQNGSDTQVSTESPYTFTISENTEMKAVFASASMYTLTVNKAGTGANYGSFTLSPEPTEGKYYDGTTVTVTAVPNAACTFTQWENESTVASREITINGADVNITGTFAITNFITAWDFRNTSTRTDYESDFYIDNDHKATLNDYQSDGTKVSWVNNDETTMDDTDGISRTHIGARRSDDKWKDNSGKHPYYFQTVVNTVGYSNVKVHSYVEVWGADAYKTQKIMYSTDGTTFYQLASVDLTTHRKWHLLEGQNNAIDNQPTLYLRWTYSLDGDRMSGFNEDNAEDLRIGDIVISGDKTTFLDENTDYTPVAETDARVKLTRTINAGNWSTIVLPFDMTADQVTTTFGEGTKLAGIFGYAENTLNTVEQTYITANEPCFIRVANDFSSATISGVTIKEGTPEKVIDGIKLVGKYSSGTIADGDYFLSNNNLYKSTGKSKIKPFRAYFTDVPTTEAQARIAFFSDGEITFINDVSKTGNEIPANPVYYNLNGQRVISPSKGLYIVNGKKVIID